MKRTELFVESLLYVPEFISKCFVNTFLCEPIPSSVAIPRNAEVERVAPEQQMDTHLNLI